MDKIRQLQDMINESNRIVFFGGAGVSTESNIPDFRSADGLYKQKYRYSSLFGQPLKGNETRILPRIGSLIESPGFYPNLTGTENLQIFARLRGLKSPNYIKSALELVNLPYRDKKRYAQYSLGMKQRLAIALAVMHDPELLILDEPINGLDPIGIAEVRDFIRALCEERRRRRRLDPHL